MEYISLTNLILYLIYWALFGLLHSVTTSSYIKSRVSLDPRSYRIGYNIFSIITFALLLTKVPSPLDLVLSWIDKSAITKLVSGFIFIMGSFIVMWGLTFWDFSSFLGFTQEDDKLITTGPYRLSRHPVYTGIIIILISLVIIDISVVSLSWFFGAGGYLALGSIYEEKKLESKFGNEYREYKSKIPWLFPYRIGQLRLLIT